MDWDATTNTVTRLANAPVDPARLYLVCLNYGMLEGLDNVAPLLEYKRAQPPGDGDIHRPPEAATLAKDAIVSHFSKAVLFYMLKAAGGFASLDADGDGVLSRDELLAGVAGTTGSSSSSSSSSGGGTGAAPTALMVSNLFNLADADGSGTISKVELLALSLSMTTMRFPASRQEDMLSLDEIAREVTWGLVTDFTWLLTYIVHVTHLILTSLSCLLLDGVGRCVGGAAPRAGFGRQRLPHAARIRNVCVCVAGDERT